MHIHNNFLSDQPKNIDRKHTASITVHRGAFHLLEEHALNRVVYIEVPCFVFDFQYSIYWFEFKHAHFFLFNNILLTLLFWSLTRSFTLLALTRTHRTLLLCRFPHTRTHFCSPFGKRSLTQHLSLRLPNSRCDATVNYQRLSDFNDVFTAFYRDEHQQREVDV